MGGLSTRERFFGEEWNMSTEPIALADTEINAVTTGFRVVILENNEIGTIAFSAHPGYFSWNEQDNYFPCARFTTTAFRRSAFSMNMCEKINIRENDQD
jgi:hypothetical protein